MNYGVLGTGMVGNALANKLLSLGHDVMMGSRTTDNEKLRTWLDSTNGRGQAGTFADAARFANVLINCTSGAASIDVLRSCDAADLVGKILIDIANPLDFSNGMPPSLFICNTDSLGERIQATFPALRVVKTLNTLNCELMVNPSLLSSDHDLFMSGNDADAKSTVRQLLESFGWTTIHDLGDITTARGTEMILPIWIRLWGALGTPMFNFKVVGG